VVAVYDLSVISGGAIEVSTIDTSGEPVANAVPANPLLDDTHQRKGEFDLTAVSPILLVSSTLDSGPQGVSIGTGTTAGGELIAPDVHNPLHLLKGEYGVVRPLLLNLANPSAEPRTAYLYAVPNGYAKASIWLNGDAAPIPMPCIGPSPLP
jgi:hypothetical protein